jgi:hypothetical protein
MVSLAPGPGVLGTPGPSFFLFFFLFFRTVVRTPPADSQKEPFNGKSRPVLSKGRSGSVVPPYFAILLPHFRSKKTPFRAVTCAHGETKKRPFPSSRALPGDLPPSDASKPPFSR